MSNKFIIKGDYYDGYFCKKSVGQNTVIYSQTSPVIDGIHPTKAMTYNSQSTNMWFPCVTMRKEEPDKLGEGFHCVFNIGETFFGNENGYNGAVGFAWTNRMMTDSEIIPLYAHFCSYNSTVESNLNLVNPKFLYGLLGPGIAAASSLHGLSITFYPDTSGFHLGSCKVSHYKIMSYDTQAVYKSGDLPEAIDLSYDNVLALEPSYGKYNFFLNGVYVDSLDFISDTSTGAKDQFIENNCYFAAAMMGSGISSGAISITDAKSIEKWDR